MATFVLPSGVSSEGVRHVKSLVGMDREFDAQLKRQCPGVTRVASYTLLGAYDFWDIFEEAKVALITNSFGVASTHPYSYTLLRVHGNRGRAMTYPYMPPSSQKMDVGLLQNQPLPARVGRPSR